MEAYYKERKKQLTAYSKKIKKLVNTGRLEEVPRLKKEYTELLIKPPPFKRDMYMTEYAYGQKLNQVIRDSENKFIELKLDLCYDLHDGLKEFDEQEKSISILRRNRETLLAKKRERELLHERTQKENKDKINRILNSYSVLESEDKKVTYKEIEQLSSRMANPTRQVIAYEIEHKELEYRLAQLYDPLYPVKISV